MPPPAPEPMIQTSYVGACRRANMRVSLRGERWKSSPRRTLWRAAAVLRGKVAACSRPRQSPAPTRAIRAGPVSALQFFMTPEHRLDGADNGSTTASRTQAIPRTTEEEEREAAIRRGEERERAAAQGGPRPNDGGVARTWASVAAWAFQALAENVRDYAIFLMDPNGVIVFWGEGARLMKWWSKD